MPYQPDSPQSDTPDAPTMVGAIADIAGRSQRLLAEILLRRRGDDKTPSLDPLNIGGAFFDMTAKMMSSPAKLIQAQSALWQNYFDLCQSSTKRLLGEQAAPVAVPDSGDRRFRHPSWDENEVFNFMKQSYLLTARWLRDTVSDVEGLDERTAQKVDFYTRQFVDALSPSNFALTNPEVMKATVDSRGENLIKGLQNLLKDMERGKGRLATSMTDDSAFEVGRNIATTPGKVVFRNDMLELIQYQPTTKTVYERPLLIIPPWINKYYILDLKPENSLVKWAIDQGHTVFVVSWVNPDARFAKKSFDNYMLEGPLACLDAIARATGENHQVNVIGYCIGGTLLAATLSYMEARGDKRFRSATYLTTLVDFEDAGELSVFIDETQLKSLDESMSKKGYLEGHAMATTFNLLRANELIWSFVVNNYLLGKDPFPFDLLFWNSDSTRLPAAVHSFYLHEMYQKNNLVKPGKIVLDGVPIDLGRNKLPAYIMGTKEDHIAPWKSTYRATQIYAGPVRFVLAASGHIAGVVNPPTAKKYHHWVNPMTPVSPDAWFEDATQVEGSWWPDWATWVKRHAGKMTHAPRIPGSGKLKALADAPGTYVKVTSE